MKKLLSTFLLSCVMSFAWAQAKYTATSKVFIPQNGGSPQYSTINVPVSFEVNGMTRTVQIGEMVYTTKALHGTGRTDDGGMVESYTIRGDIFNKTIISIVSNPATKRLTSIGLSIEGEGTDVYYLK